VFLPEIFGMKSGPVGCVCGAEDVSPVDDARY